MLVIISVVYVRYGDLCPKSIPAKVFAILWFLVGLVLFAVFMGTLASLLTVTTVKYTIRSTAGTDTKTVITDFSLEFKVSVPSERFSDINNDGVSFLQKSVQVKKSECKILNTTCDVMHRAYM